MTLLLSACGLQPERRPNQEAEVLVYRRIWPESDHTEPAPSRLAADAWSRRGSHRITNRLRVRCHTINRSRRIWSSRSGQVDRWFDFKLTHYPYRLPREELSHRSLRTQGVGIGIPETTFHRQGRGMRGDKQQRPESSPTGDLLGYQACNRNRCVAAPRSE